MVEGDLLVVNISDLSKVSQLMQRSGNSTHASKTASGGQQNPLIGI